MKVKCKARINVLNMIEMRVAFIQGNTYDAYESQIVSKCYEIINEYGERHLYSEDGFRRDFEIIGE